MTWNYGTNEFVIGSTQLESQPGIRACVEGGVMDPGQQGEAFGKARAHKVCPVCTRGLSAPISVGQHVSGKQCAEARAKRLKVLHTAGTLAGVWPAFAEAFRQLLSPLMKEEKAVRDMAELAWQQVRKELGAYGVWGVRDEPVLVPMAPEVGRSLKEESATKYAALAQDPQYSQTQSTWQPTRTEGGYEWYPERTRGREQQGGPSGWNPYLEHSVTRPLPTRSEMRLPVQGPSPRQLSVRPQHPSGPGELTEYQWTGPGGGNNAPVGHSAHPTSVRCHGWDQGWEERSCELVPVADLRVEQPTQGTPGNLIVLRERISAYAGKTQRTNTFMGGASKQDTTLALPSGAGALVGVPDWGPVLATAIKPPASSGRGEELATKEARQELLKGAIEEVKREGGKQAPFRPTKKSRFDIVGPASKGTHNTDSRMENLAKVVASINATIKQREVQQEGKEEKEQQQPLQQPHQHQHNKQEPSEPAAARTEVSRDDTSQAGPAIQGNFQQQQQQQQRQSQQSNQQQQQATNQVDLETVISQQLAKQLAAYFSSPEFQATQATITAAAIAASMHKQEQTNRPTQGSEEWRASLVAEPSPKRKERGTSTKHKRDVTKNEARPVAEPTLRRETQSTNKKHKYGVTKKKASTQEVPSTPPSRGCRGDTTQAIQAKVLPAREPTPSQKNRGRKNKASN